jgi:hypothetical protein
MNKYYVFDSEQKAKDAEACICESSNMPITGTNSQTKELEPNKTKTERWAIPRERLDGKWTFPIVDHAKCCAPKEFDINHPNTQEEYLASWFGGAERE